MQMSSFKGRQWLTIAGGAILLASLFFVNRKSPQKAATMPFAGKDSSAAHVSFDSLVDQAQKQLTGWAKIKIDAATKALNGAGSEKKVQLYDTIIKVYDSIGMELQANYYLEKEAGIQHSLQKWRQAGEGYYNFALLMNPAARTVVLQRALNCFTNALKIDSADLDSRVGMGQCIVESGGNPMEGISMIEEVLKADSDNFKAQLALGEFSIQSGQYPKAIARFKKILKLSPSYIKAYLYLAQAYESSGDKKTAVSYLKKYSTFATDTSLKRQVDEYITKFESDTKNK